jgi:glucokinase
MTQDGDLILAMDIGGTKIAMGLVDRTAKVHHRTETLTQANEGRAGILRRIESMGKKVMACEPISSIRAIGVASAGQIDNRTGRVNYATENLPGWNQLDLTDILESLFGLPVTADNDVNAMAVAEMKFGAGRGFREVFCLMVGTGIGGAIIANGELYSGVLGGAGEVGHSPIQVFGGRPCTCGRTGCLEAYGSSRALLNDFIQAAGPQEILNRLGMDALSLTILDLATAFRDSAHQDWTALQQSVASAAEVLGTGLVSVVNLLSPELVVLGGSIQLLGDSYLMLVQESMRQRVMIPRQDTRLCFSQLGPDSPLVGSALLAYQRLL